MHPVSADFNFHPPDLFSDLSVGGMLAELFQVWILGKPLKIAVSKTQCLFQRQRGALKLVGKRITARQVVKYNGVARCEARQAFIHLQAVSVTAALSVMIAEKLEGVHIIWITADESFHEGDLGVEIPLAGGPRLFP